MLNKQGFNLWAEDYDKSVQLSEERNEYPFAGYKEILNTIYNEIMQQPSSTVLDIGIGTGVLSKKLYDHGHRITGVDFSSKMLELSKEKMPQARFVEWDIAQGAPMMFEETSFDVIVSTYTLHHLTDTQKISFLKSLSILLKPNGQILIGDIAFKTEEQLKQCKVKNKSHWDEDEFYFVYEVISDALSETYDVQYEQFSECGGIYKLTGK